jgi:putrescine:ornithine antiporter
VTVWGVIIPVAGLSIIGWFYIKSSVFMEAWNPKGMTLGAGMGSSIALTLWAFLGMESAAQNSDAVENPKRDVPLACMFGTLGAAVVYILSTTVIQGIVPNAELAKSTGPFALAYAKMFNPAIGQIIMGLAVLACLGSLLGWQFTIAQTAKSAAADRFFPTVFSKENSMGAPVAGMVIMGIVQTVMALSTVSPSLSEQFSALVNLAVVTNVIPYIISLSALVVMMKGAGVADNVYKRNVFIGTVATLYSTYAIFASGKDAVLGGMIVLALTYIFYGFLAPRFVGASAQAGTRPGARAAQAAAALLALIFTGMLLPSPVYAQKAKAPGKLTYGYYPNVRPLSFTDESGKPAGYAVELCQKIADAAGLQPAWVAVTPGSAAAMLREGKVQLMCGEFDRLSARKDMSFSIPIFQSGLGALLRTDAPPALKNALSEQPAPSGPTWRGTPTQGLLQQQVIAVIGGSPAEKVVHERLKTLQLSSRVVQVKDADEGVQAVLGRKASVFFADRSFLLSAAKGVANTSDLTVHDRRFTLAPVALAVKRGDEDGRLAADRALSRIYAAPEFRDLYAKWLGASDEATAIFFRSVALPE